MILLPLLSYYEKIVRHVRVEKPGIVYYSIAISIKCSNPNSRFCLLYSWLP